MAILCRYQGQELTIEDAIQIKANLDAQELPSPEFRCTSCGELVRTLRKGGKYPAHFEHFKRNPNCELSHPAPNSSKRSKAIVNRPSLEEVLEGESRERTLMVKKRNKTIVKDCKIRDENTCQACGFQLDIDGTYIIDCHHLNPLGEEEETITSIDDLICLCPNCHRIAHAERPPMKLEDLKKIVCSQN